MLKIFFEKLESPAQNSKYGVCKKFMLSNATVWSKLVSSLISPSYLSFEMYLTRAGLEVIKLFSIPAELSSAQLSMKFKILI